MKKRKEEQNITVECFVSQRSKGPIEKSTAREWDIVELAFNLETSGLLLQIAQKDPEIRQKIIDRVVERIEELIDAIEVV